MSKPSSLIHLIKYLPKRKEEKVKRESCKAFVSCERGDVHSATGAMTQYQEVIFCMLSAHCCHITVPPKKQPCANLLCLSQSVIQSHSAAMLSDSCQLFPVCVCVSCWDFSGQTTALCWWTINCIKVLSCCWTLLVLTSQSHCLQWHTKMRECSWNLFTPTLKGKLKCSTVKASVTYSIQLEINNNF